MPDADARRASVSEYYGETLQTSADLKTSACCPVDAAPAAHRAILSKLHPDVVTQFYGCGSPVPSLITGATVLDLGCGTGRDVYLASALVGPTGRVIGVDMTESQLAVAIRTRAFHAEKLLGPGAEPNVDFRRGVIEDLGAAGVEAASCDVVSSNCVCNLCADKGAVWKETARVLRDGGEMYFSDVYADRRLSAEAQADETLVAECLGGALYVEDARRIMAEAGFADMRIVSAGPIDIADASLRKLVPDVQFYSLTVRAFKVDGLADRRENFGQTALYKGDEDEFVFDVDFTFPKGVKVPVDSNTASILCKSRLSKWFDVSEPGPHQGLFDSRVDGGALQGMLRKAMGGGCGVTDNGGSNTAATKGDCGPKATKGGCGPPASKGSCAPVQASSGCSPSATNRNGGCGEGKKC